MVKSKAEQTHNITVHDTKYKTSLRCLDLYSLTSFGRNQKILGKKWKSYDPALGTEKLDYTSDEANELHCFSRQLGIYVSNKIKEVILERTLAMNSKIDILPSNTDSLQVDHFEKILNKLSTTWIKKKIEVIDDRTVIKAICELSNKAESWENKKFRHIVRKNLPKYNPAEKKLIYDNKNKFIIKPLVDSIVDGAPTVNVLVDSLVKWPTWNTAILANIEDHLGQEKYKSFNKNLVNEPEIIADQLFNSTEPDTRIKSLLVLIKHPDAQKNSTLFLLKFFNSIDTNQRDANSTNISSFFNEALEQECRSGKVDIVKEYLKLNNLKPNPSLIITAVKSENLEIVKLIANALGNDCVNYIDRYYWNAAHYAAWKNRKEILEFFKNTYPSMLDAKTGKGKINGSETVLVVAARYNRKEAVKYLFNAKNDLLNIGDQNERTPLGWAYYNNNMDIFNALLAAGADPNCNYKKEPLLYDACKNAYTKLLHNDTTEFAKALIKKINTLEPVKKNEIIAGVADFKPLNAAYESKSLNIFNALLVRILILICKTR